MIQLSPRESFILSLIERADGGMKTKEVVEAVRGKFNAASRVTVIRDLNHLVAVKHLVREGKGRGVKYKGREMHPWLHTIDLESYLLVPTDDREVRERIDFGDKGLEQPLLEPIELKRIRKITDLYRSNYKKLDEVYLAREFERITVDFSWKSSQIEGNTYTLLDTEELLLKKKEAPGHPKKEAMMIVNHKSALDYIREIAGKRARLTLRDIEDVHNLVVKELGVPGGIRKHPVGIIGTAYVSYDNSIQVKEALEKLCELVNIIKNPLEKAMIAVAGISYIQPFVDGNKRAARLMGNSILLAHDYCPLSYRSVDEMEYKKALIVFYEQWSVIAFKKIYMEQYAFAGENYFRA